MFYFIKCWQQSLGFRTQEDVVLISKVRKTAEPQYVCDIKMCDSTLGDSTLCDSILGDLKLCRFHRV